MYAPYLETLAASYVFLSIYCSNRYNCSNHCLVYEDIDYYQFSVFHCTPPKSERILVNCLWDGSRHSCYLSDPNFKPPLSVFFLEGIPNK